MKNKMKLHEYVDKRIGTILFYSLALTGLGMMGDSCTAIKDAYNWKPKTEAESNQVYQIQRQHRDMIFPDLQRDLEYQRSVTR